MSRQSIVWLIFIILIFGLCGCAILRSLGWSHPKDERHREMGFQMGNLEVRIKYQDPSVIDIRLKDSRILPFHFSIKNISEYPVLFTQKYIGLNVGIPQPLEPVSVDDVLEETRRSKSVPTFFINVLKILKSQSSAFHPTSQQRLVQELHKRKMQDGYVQPGETKIGLVFFMLPEEPFDINWSNLEFSHHPPQAIETKGWQIHTNPKEDSFFERFRKFWKKYMHGEPPPFNKSYALLIGIGKYKHLSGLASPAEDVGKMEGFLYNEQGFDETVYATDEDVKLSDIQNPQSYFHAKIQEDDRFFFYYSGHGLTRALPGGRTRGYLPLVDERPGSCDNSIAMDSLVEWMMGLKAKHILVVLDCCFSGLAVKGVETKAGDLEYEGTITEEVLTKLSKLPARFLLMAGTEGQQSIAGDKWNGSLFTDVLIKGLRNKGTDNGADMCDDGIITVRELYVWLRPTVVKQAADVNRELYPLLKDLEPYSSYGEFFFIRK